MGSDCEDVTVVHADVLPSFLGMGGDCGGGLFLSLYVQIPPPAARHRSQQFLSPLHLICGPREY